MCKIDAFSPKNLPKSRFFFTDLEDPGRVAFLDLCLGGVAQLVLGF